MIKIPPLTVIEHKDDSQFERVEVFLRAKGRLPTKKGDGLTQEVLDEFCDKYEKKKLKEGMISLDYLYLKIKSGKIKPFILDKNEVVEGKDE